MFWPLIRRLWCIGNDEIPLGLHLAVMAHTYGVMKDRTLVPATTDSLELGIAFAEQHRAPLCTGSDSARDPLTELQGKYLIKESKRFSNFHDLGSVLNAIQEVRAFQRYIEANRSQLDGVIIVCEAFQARRMRLICRRILKVPFYVQTFESQWPAGNWNPWHDSKLKWLAVNVAAFYATWILGVERLEKKQVGGLKAIDRTEK